MSKKFKEAVKLAPQLQYELAWAAEMCPQILSQIVTGYIRPKVGDPRVIRIGRILGLKPSECFVSKKEDAGLAEASE